MRGAGEAGALAGPEWPPVLPGLLLPQFPCPTKGLRRCLGTCKVEGVPAPPSQPGALGGFPETSLGLGEQLTPRESPAPHTSHPVPGVQGVSGCPPQGHLGCSKAVFNQAPKFRQGAPGAAGRATVSSTPGLRQQQQHGFRERPQPGQAASGPPCRGTMTPAAWARCGHPDMSLGLCPAGLAEVQDSAPVTPRQLSPWVACTALHAACTS